jgi:hypothetical protein
MPKRISRIEINTLPHARQRYPTAGDWWEEPAGNETALVIRISRITTRSILEYPLMIHELVEALLCHAAGIPDAAVDDWDFAHRESDPGLDPSCPYHTQHLVATDMEYRMVRALGIPEPYYNETLQSLDAEPQPPWPAANAAEEPE